MERDQSKGKAMGLRRHRAVLVASSWVLSPADAGDAGGAEHGTPKSSATGCPVLICGRQLRDIIRLRKEP